MLQEKNNKLLKEYINLYLDVALDKFEMSDITRKWIRTLAIDAIPVVKEKYFAGGSDKKSYKFSAYFSSQIFSKYHLHALFK